MKVERDKDGWPVAFTSNSKPVFYQDRLGTSYCWECAGHLPKRSKITMHINNREYVECQHCCELQYGEQE